MKKHKPMVVPASVPRNPLFLHGRTKSSAGFHGDKDVRSLRRKANDDLRMVERNLADISTRGIHVSSLDEFLCGETCPDRFGECSFFDYADDVLEDWRESSFRRLPLREEYLLADTGYNVYLLFEKSGEISMVGFYEGPTVCVHPDHQGKGLGAELILETALVREGPPTLGYQKQMFSEAGLAAHRRAYFLAESRGLLNGHGEVDLGRYL